MASSPLAFHDHSTTLENVADAIPQIALHFDGVFDDSATGAAGAFELLTQLLEKGGIAREVVDDRDALAGAPLLFHA